MAIITVLIVLGGVTAGLIWAMEQQVPRPTPTAPPEALVRPPEATPGAKAQDMSTPIPIPIPIPILMPERTSKPEPRTETLEEKEASSEPESGGQGTVYTWYDGNRIRRVVLQTRPAVQETEAAASTTEDGRNKAGGFGWYRPGKSPTRQRSPACVPLRIGRRVDDIAGRRRSGPRPRVGPGRR